jgi:fructokinase
MILWGIDLGGTKIECSIIKLTDKSQYEVLYKERLPTDSTKGYDPILLKIKLLVANAQASTGLKPNSVGICTPCIIDRETKVLKNANVVCLNNRNLTADLSKTLNLPVFHANNANCFILAETLMGAAKTLPQTPQLAFGVILGTGVGGGIVIKNQVFEGLHGIAGEWGHNFIETTSHRCHCGKNGCLESFISGGALERFYSEKSSQRKTLQEIHEGFLTKTDLRAIETIERLKNYFGKAISQIINVLDPDVIILGGGVSNIDYLYQNISASVIPYLFNKELKTPILKHAIGDSAGVVGAALLTLEN